MNFVAGWINACVLRRAAARPSFAPPVYLWDSAVFDAGRLSARAPGGPDAQKRALLDTSLRGCVTGALAQVRQSCATDGDAANALINAVQLFPVHIPAVVDKPPTEVCTTCHVCCFI